MVLAFPAFAKSMQSFDTAYSFEARIAAQWSLDKPLLDSFDNESLYHWYRHFVDTLNYCLL
jgi:hypothetical protein